MSRRKKKSITEDLDKQPAAVVMSLVNHAIATQRETLTHIDKMLGNVELQDETRTVLIAKRSDMAKQATELAVSVTAAFGKKQAQAQLPPATGLPSTPASGETFSPPRPGAVIKAISVTKEPK